MEEYVYLQLTSSKVLIFDWKYLIIQNYFVGRSLIACPNFDNYILFSPYNRNNVRQTNVQT